MKKPKPGYKETYHRLVQPKNLAQIKAILREQTDFDLAIVESLQYKQKNKRPFLFAEVDSGKRLGFGNYGMIDGVFPDMKSLLPGWPGRFYLPIIFVRKPRNAKMKAYVAKKQILEHELEHLSYSSDFRWRNIYPACWTCISKGFPSIKSAFRKFSEQRLRRWAGHFSAPMP